MLSKSFASQCETKFHALLPGHAQSLIFDGLVVEATLLRDRVSFYFLLQPQV